MSIKLNGATNGSVELDVPAAIGSDLSVTIPATAGELTVKATDGSVDLGAIDIAASAPADSVNIDSSGRLLVGTSSARSNYRNSVTPTIQLEETSDKGLCVFSNVNGGAGPYIWLGKSRGTSIGSSTIVQSGDVLGSIRFNGADGSNVILAASIRAEVDGTPGAGDMPCRLVFSTTADGASSPTERMRITSGGQTRLFAAANDNVLAIQSAESAGTATYAFFSSHSASNNTTAGTVSFGVFTNGNAVNTNNSYGPLSSDERLKQDIVDAGSQWDDIKAVRLTKFRYKNDPIGELQLGPIAQELEQVSPGLVTRRPASEDEIADPSNDLVDGDEVLSFKASILYMKAVKALQEAMERIETLEASNAALETRLTALEGGAS